MKNSLEYVSGAIAAGSAIGVGYTFLLGGHYIIPTILLVDSIIFGYLAVLGLRGNRVAKHLLFWIALVISAHSFFALFHAVTPPTYLGQYFHPLYISSTVIFAVLAATYAKANLIFR